MRLALAIDAGGSSTRWALVRLGTAPTVVTRGSLGPLSGLSFLPGADGTSRDAALATVRQLARQVDEAIRTLARDGAPLHLQRVLAGVTGTTSGDAATVQVASAIDGVLAADGHRPQITVVSDLELMHGASFSPGEGLLVYAGTGSIAVHRTRDLRWLRVGGHGFLLDDAGGGFWIGQRALRAWMRAWDEAATPADVAAAEARPVFAALERHVGSRDWSAVRSFAYGGGRTAVASLVPIVGAAAAEGDLLASSWIREAGTELARLATVLARRVRIDRADPLDAHGAGVLPVAEPLTDPVVVAGGVTNLGEPLLQAIVAALPRGMTATIAARSPLDAAVSIVSR